MSLDPVATQRIEELMTELRNRTTMMIVTHNIHRAVRISDDCAFLLMAVNGVSELAEVGPTSQIFHQPTDPRTLDCVNGRIG